MLFFKNCFKYTEIPFDSLNHTRDFLLGPAKLKRNSIKQHDDLLKRPLERGKDKIRWTVRLLNKTENEFQRRESNE